MDSETLRADIQVVFYIKVAFLALLIYDTVLQLNEEYLHIWRSRWTIIKALYLWTRYGTFVGATAPLIHALLKGFFVCDEVTMFTTAFSLFGIGITQLILMIRTYTLYQRSKSLLLFFGLMWFTIAALALWTGLRWVHSFNDIEALGPDLAVTCYVSTPRTTYFAKFASWALLASETTIFLLTLWKVCHKFPDKTGMLQSLHRDGVWFYPAILPFTVASLICLYVAPSGLREVFDTPVQVMHSILVCRLITHTRTVAAEDAAREYEINKVFSHHGYSRSGSFGDASTQGRHWQVYGKLRQCSDSDEVLDISAGNNA
ncbi:hypothetical protein MIND_00932300 [Mycena indigotica]|uniref:DUF6533 domain-containing protein n=1 Tax=Mycena indigotica TaxID=2126181 RepID=A0A8H6SDY8_9AGAR|nr:uncharacterized protein MIND_00932300 [Mycena indigotica]KAF7297000.1 hypothetical protein MIND_00932300 [Mycena indigotica]